VTAGLDGRMEVSTGTTRSKTLAPLDRILTWARAAVGFQSSDNDDVIVVDDALVDTRECGLGPAIRKHSAWTPS
jgi:hypothetical protein